MRRVGGRGAEQAGGGHSWRRAMQRAPGGRPLSYATLFLSYIPRPDAFSFNTLLHALALSPRPRRALPFFFRFLALGFSPNSYSFPPLALSAARDPPSLHAAELVHAQALKRGAFSAALPVRNSLIHMYACCGLDAAARALFDEMPFRDLVSWNSIVACYARLGDLAAARQLFDCMPERNCVSWNVIIGGYLRWRKPELALDVFRRMAREGGVRGSEKTMVCLATACGRTSALREGRSVHAHFVRGFEGSNLIFETALVDMYSKCRRVGAARRVFDGMTERNLICWNAMVLGHCIHGSAEAGLALFNTMVEEGKELEDRRADNSMETKTERISPDEVTFVGVLCGCARAGLLSEGRMYFGQMNSVYNIKPTFAHYWCMANLYGGLGMVQEAEEVLKSMPEEKESLVWSSLLGLCRFRGDVELGERIAKRLIELEPYNSSRYALLWNIYVVADRWEDVQNVKEMMEERGVKVLPGHSLLDLKEIVHNFKVGDRSQPEVETVYMMMDDFAASLKLTRDMATSCEGSLL